MFDKLVIQDTILHGPGPGQPVLEVLDAYYNAGVADHMHPDVTRGMREIVEMLRKILGTENTYTYGVVGTGFNAGACVSHLVRPEDKVIVFVNGTFSGIDGLQMRMRAASAEDLERDSLDPLPNNVVIVDVPHGASVTRDVIETAFTEHRPAFAFMAHLETGSGRLNDLQAFSDLCIGHNVMGIVDAVSSVGVLDFKLDDYPGVEAWFTCPQKGMLALPGTYGVVSFTDMAIERIREFGCNSYTDHPILQARHWGINVHGEDGQPAGYHQTHSPNAVASFHEACRLLLEKGIANIAAEYVWHEAALRAGMEALGFVVTSDMPSLVVANFTGELAGKERDFVNAVKARNYGIWPTLSNPVQVRVGILNQLDSEKIVDLVRVMGSVLTAEFGADGGLISNSLRAVSDAYAQDA